MSQVPYFSLLLAKPLEDPKKTTEIILEALTNTGQRGIIDRGWGDLGSGKLFGSILSLQLPLAQI